MENTTDEEAARTGSERIRRIHERVCRVRSSEEIGVKYMQAWEERYYAEQEGREQGLEEGREAGIRVLILDNMEEQRPRACVIEKIKKYYGLEQEDAEDYFQRFAREKETHAEQ